MSNTNYMKAINLTKNKGKFFATATGIIETRLKEEIAKFKRV